MLRTKWIWYVLIVLFISTVTAKTLVHSDTIPKTLTLGGLVWKQGFNDQNKNVHLIEYVTGNENVNNWTKLVTVQIFKFQVNNKFTPEHFAEAEMAPLKADKKFKIYYKILSSTPSEAILEFRVSSPKDQQQNEIQRIVRTSDNRVIVLHYVIKRSDMGDAERKKWIEALKEVQVR